MKKKLFFILSIFTLLILFSCASSKQIQKVDGPDDYYEQETPNTEPVAKEQEKTPANVESEKNAPAQPKTTAPASTISNSTSTPKKESKSQKVENNKNNDPSAESQTTTNKVEENSIPPEVQEELGDDSWAKDESKVKLKKKDKEKIKDSSADDDKWGKE